MRRPALELGYMGKGREEVLAHAHLTRTAQTSRRRQPESSSEDGNRVYQDRDDRRRVRASSRLPRLLDVAIVAACERSGSIVIGKTLGMAPPRAHFLSPRHQHARNGSRT